MTKIDILSQVVQLIAETIAVPSERITPELAIGDIPQWNSMANMAIVFAIESNLGVEIPDEDLFELTSVESIVNEVMKLKGSQA